MNGMGYGNIGNMGNSLAGEYKMELTNDFAKQGANLCKALTEKNKGDYLTSKVNDEVSSLISQIESLSADIESVQAAVDAKIAEIAARETEDDTTDTDTDSDTSTKGSSSTEVTMN